MASKHRPPLPVAAPAVLSLIRLHIPRHNFDHHIKSQDVSYSIRANNYLFSTLRSWLARGREETTRRSVLPNRSGVRISPFFSERLGQQRGQLVGEPTDNSLVRVNVGHRIVLGICVCVDVWVMLLCTEYSGEMEYCFAGVDVGCTKHK